MVGTSDNESNTEVISPKTDEHTVMMQGDLLKQLDAMGGYIAGILKLQELPDRNFTVRMALTIGFHVIGKASSGKDRLMTYRYVENGDRFIRVEEWIQSEWSEYQTRKQRTKNK